MDVESKTELSASARLSPSSSHRHLARFGFILMTLTLANLTTDARLELPIFSVAQLATSDGVLSAFLPSLARSSSTSLPSCSRMLKG
jgi:hypothetical protein